MIQAKKRFGQNFLKDSYILDQIIQSIPQDVENIVEIGAGLGDLTQKLLKFKNLISYEIDLDLEAFLINKFSKELKSNKLKLVFGDAKEIWEDSGICQDKYFLVANLPYYVATNLILKAIDDENCIGFIVMIQKEVALKFANEDNSLGILANFLGDTKILFDVAPACFDPMPKVTSSVIKLIKDKRIKDFFDEEEYKEFKNFIKCSFTSPKKILFKNLNTKFNKDLLRKTFITLDIKENIRAHELNFALFLKIFKSLKAQNGREQ